MPAKGHFLKIKIYGKLAERFGAEIAAFQSGLAELARVLAAKKSAERVPLGHPLALAKAEVTIKRNDDLPGVDRTMEIGGIRVTQKSDGRSGNWTAA